MKRILNILMFIPLVGITAPYLYIGCSMFILDSVNIYENDPKSIGINFLYELALYTSVIGMLSIGLLVFIIAFELLYKKVQIKNIKGKYAFVLGVLLTLILRYYDIGDYLNWFFD